MKIKRIIVLALVAIMLFAMTACDNIANKPQKDFGEYPELPKGDGYTITGRITDQKGNPLPGAVVYFGDKSKVRGVTDKNGEYKIAGVKGDVKLIASYLDYTFDKREVAVSGSSEVNFVGKNSYSASAETRDINGGALYQVSYLVDGKLYQSKGDSMVYFDGRNGLTRITPQADGFVFEPAYKDVYNGQQVSFVARAASGTYSVKGSIDTSSLKEDEAPPMLYITVNGKRYTDVLSTYDYDYTTGESKLRLYYEVYGLKEGQKYTIAMVDESGETAAESYTVEGETKNLNFKLNMTREFDIRVKPLNLKSKFTDLGKEFVWKYFDYKLIVKDENGNEIAKRYGDEDLVEAVRVWAGCKVYIVGEYYDKANGVHYSVEDWLPINPADMRDKTVTELELTFIFEKYVEED